MGNVKQVAIFGSIWAPNLHVEGYLICFSSSVSFAISSINFVSFCATVYLRDVMHTYLLTYSMVQSPS